MDFILFDVMLLIITFLKSWPKTEPHKANNIKTIGQLKKEIIKGGDNYRNIAHDITNSFH